MDSPLIWKVSVGVMLTMRTTFAAGLSVSIGIVALLAGRAGAQGVAPPSLREKAVQRQLKLSEDQSREVAAFFDALDASERGARQKFAQASPDERGRIMEEMRASSLKQLNAILAPGQFKRLEQIELQRAGFSALRSPKVQADLKLTADQRSRVEAIVGQAMGQIRQSGMEFQGDPAAARARREEIGKAALAQVVALLAPVQRATWTEMTGPPFDAPPEPPPDRPAAGGSGGPPAARKAEMTRPAADPRPRAAVPKRAPAPATRRPSPNAAEGGLPEGMVGLPETFFGGNRDRFVDVAPAGGVLVGVRVSYIMRLGGPKVSSVQPVYRIGERLVDGKRHGTLLSQESKAIAKPDYAVGAIKTHTGLTVDGFELVFMKVDGDHLDANDSYKSSWLGDVKGGSPRDVSTEGKVPVGLQGRSGKEVKALGLIVRE